MHKSWLARPWQIHAIQAERLKRVMVPIILREFGASNVLGVMLGHDWSFRDRYGGWHYVSTEQLVRDWCPYVPGSKLVVREGWAQADGNHDEWSYHRGKPVQGWPVLYRADNPTHGADDEYWRSPATMPSKLARYTLTIGDVRPVRVCTVSESEWEACGVDRGTDVNTVLAGMDQWATDHGRKHPWDTAHAWSIEVTGVEVRV
jgi:hypothetical protein